VVEPLTGDVPLYGSRREHAHRDGGIERDWREMADRGDLKPYLKAALAKERILLQRKDDLTEAQESAQLAKKADRTLRELRHSGR